MTMNTITINCEDVPRFERPESKNDWNEIKGSCCVIENGVTNNHSLELNFDTIKELLPDQEIQLNESLDSEDKIILSTFSDYVDFCQNKKNLTLNYFDNVTGITGSHTFTEEPIYLLNYNVNYHPTLRKYIENPEYIEDWFDKYMPIYKDMVVYGKRHTWFFIGPKGTKSEMHTDHDFVHTTIQQLDGFKRFFIIPDKDINLILRMDQEYFKYLEFKLTENKDCTITDTKGTKDLNLLNNIILYYSDLKPKDVINIPSNCGHYAESLSPSISVSRDFIDERNIDSYICSIISFISPEFTQQVLEDMPIDQSYNIIKNLQLGAQQ